MMVGFRALILMESAARCMCCRAIELGNGDSCSFQVATWGTLCAAFTSQAACQMKISEPDPIASPAPLWRLAFRAGFLLAGAFAVLCMARWLYWMCQPQDWDFRA